MSIDMHHTEPDLSTASPAEDDGDWGALSALPGNPLMWVLVISELLIFGAFLAGFAGARILDPQSFAESQAHLDRVYGGLNTLVLVTSGLFAALAVRRRLDGSIRGARLWTAAAGALGLVFLGVKALEYADKLSAGYGMETNTFFTLYYLMTGFHALHVVMGLVILGIVGWKCSVENLETGAAFWHMVDLVWVLIFPVVYLIR